MAGDGTRLSLLSTEDRDRFAAEFAAGDLLALVVTEALAHEDRAATGAAIARTIALGGRGGIVTTSRTLDGQCILFIHDEHVIVPEKYRDLPRFTLAELEQIARERWSADRLRAVVMAKDVLRTADHPDEQPRLVPADEAAEMRRATCPGPGVARAVRGVAQRASA